MRVVMITTIILILFFGGALYFSHYVGVQTEGLIASINELDEVIMAKDWETGEEKLQKVKDDWNEIKGVFETLLEHYDLDSIEVSLAKIEKYMEVQDHSLAVGEITHLKFVISLIQKKESFSLSNLL